MTTFFTFPSKAAFAALLPAGVVEAPEMDIDGIAVSVLGVCYAPGTVFPPEGSSDPQPTPLPGYGVNALGVPAGWEPYIVSLTNPQRVFG